MYTLIYYVTETKGTEVIEREYHYSDEYRLRRNALHYLREIVQNDYREEGYATSLFTGGLYCMKKRENRQRRAKDNRNTYKSRKS